MKDVRVAYPFTVTTECSTGPRPDTGIDRRDIDPGRHVGNSDTNGRISINVDSRVLLLGIA